MVWTLKRPVGIKFKHTFMVRTLTWPVGIKVNIHSWFGHLHDHWESQNTFVILDTYTTSGKLDIYSLDFFLDSHTTSGNLNKQSWHFGHLQSLWETPHIYIYIYIHSWFGIDTCTTSGKSQPTFEVGTCTHTTCTKVNLHSWFRHLRDQQESQHTDSPAQIRQKRSRM